jgi:hypothetical protein
VTTTVDAEPAVIFPCSMAPANDLRRGHVVEDRDDGSRGIVTSDPGDLAGKAMLCGHGDVSIRTGPSSSCITNNHHRRWRIVPAAEQTVTERVRSAHLSFDPKQWAADSDDDDSIDGPHDDTTVAWHLLAALLPYDTYDEILGLDWPTALDLAVAVAAHIEDLNARLAAAASPLAV